MARIYRKKKFRISPQKQDDKRDNDDEKLIEIGRIDRSHYPKATFWIIFAACGAFLLWMIMKFFFILTR